MSSNMLRLLLGLFALISLRGTEALTVNHDQVVDISTCPLTYYGKLHNELYVNFTASKFVVCFGAFYDGSDTQDCIKASPPESNSTGFGTTFSSYLQFVISQQAPTIKQASTCYNTFSYSLSGSMFYFDLSKCGDQAAMGIEYKGKIVKTLEAYVDGQLSTSAQVGPQTTKSYVDVSGCRYNGKGYNANIVPQTLPNCIYLTCNTNGSLTVAPFCEDGHCDGAGSCMLNHTCTVTGPAVIDIHKQVDTVENRCTYTLVAETQPQGLSVLARFRERRRKDVSFVDSVTLRTPATEIVLGQEGKVLVNGSLLTFNSSVQELDGIELFTDATGVQATVSAFGGSALVFFDGTTAQIQIEGPHDATFNGLCGQSSNFTTSKSINDSLPGCETTYSEAADTTINCTAVEEGCSILKGGPFSSCNEVVDPAPYITACSETLCTYPSVDGLRCQFIWAYARACSLRNVTLDDWWTSSECPAPEVFCRGANCVDHEFCSVESGGDTSCLCRAVFASSYKDSNTLGDPMVCSQNSASVSLVGCLLNEKGIDYSLLHLSDDTCRGEMDPESHMVTFSFNTSNLCGSVVTANASQVTYKNAIRSQDYTEDVITRQNQFYIDFSCTHVQPEIKLSAFRIQDSSVIQHLTSGDWSYTLTMTAYTDVGHTHIVDSNTDVFLNQKIWVELDTQGLDASTIAVVTDSCWATSQASPASFPRYDLIQNGCASNADQTVALQGNGQGTSNQFSFDMFQFTGSTSEVYLHCKLSLCIKEGSSCIPNCSGGMESVKRRRRFLMDRPRNAVDRRRHSAVVSMAWSN